MRGGACVDKLLLLCYVGVRGQLGIVGLLGAPQAARDSALQRDTTTLLSGCQGHPHPTHLVGKVGSH